MSYSGAARERAMTVQEVPGGGDFWACIYAVCEDGRNLHDCTRPPTARHVGGEGQPVEAAA